MAEARTRPVEVTDSRGWRGVFRPAELADSRATADRRAGPATGGLAGGVEPGDGGQAAGAARASRAGGATVAVEVRVLDGAARVHTDPADAQRGELGAQARA